MFDGPDFKIELKEGVKPYYSRTYSFPKINEETMKNNVPERKKLTFKKKYWF